MKQRQSGFIATITVLILAVVVVSIATTVALLGIGEAQSGFALTQGEDSLQFVEGCMEDALWNARINSAYTSESITRPEGTCTITVSKAGNVWTITATSTATAYRRTVQTVVTRDGYGLTLTSWKEI